MAPNSLLKAIQRAMEVDDQREAEALLQVTYEVMAKNLQQARRGDRRAGLEVRDLRRFGGSREWLGQPIERMVLGKAPHHNLLRAVQVTDSEPVSQEQMEMGLVWTYTLRDGRPVPKREEGGEYKAFAEWLRVGTELRCAIRIDETLFSKQELDFRGAKKQTVRHLPAVCNGYARSLTHRQREFAAKYRMSILCDLYTDLQRRLQSLKPGTFLLNIG